MVATLRKPIPADYELLASWIPNESACTRWAGPRVPFPFQVAELADLLRVDNGSGYVLEDSVLGPIGFGQHFVNAPGAVHLGRIIISRSTRGHGFGKVLCELLIEQAILATSAPKLTLRVYRDNEVARILYTGLGFKVVDKKSDDKVLFMEARIN